VTSIALLIVSILRAFVEVALLGLAGQCVLGLLSGAARERNPIYRFFCIVTRPPLRAMRFVIPGLIVDRHIPAVAFFVLFWLWILLAYVKRSIAA